MWRSSGEMQSLSDDDGFWHRGGVASCQTDMIAELMAALFFSSSHPEIVNLPPVRCVFFFFFILFIFFFIRGRIALGGQQKANALPAKCCLQHQAIAQIQCI